MMKTAIVIPCYNAAQFLPELFEGITEQSIKFDEIICYDDCSQDATVDVAASLGARVIRGDRNRGAAYSRNQGYRASNAEWIHFHDADDLISPRFLGHMLTFVSAAVGAVIGNIEIRDRRTRRVIGYTDYDELLATHDPVEYFIRNIGYATNSLYSRDWLERIGGFREDLRGHEDPDLHVRLAAAGCKFRVSKERLVVKLEHPTSFSAMNSIQCRIDQLKCLESYAETLGNHYRPIIGFHAVCTASFLNNQRFPNRIAWVKRGLLLARQCGEYGAGSNGRFKAFLAKIIGVNIIFGFRSIRAYLLSRDWRRTLFNSNNLGE